MLVSIYTSEIKWKSNKIAGTIVFCVVIFFVAGQGYRSYRTISLNIPWNNRSTHVMVTDITQNLPPEGTIQPLLFTGMHKALVEMRLQPHTRFIYDFHFYHDVTHPYIRKLRHEFITALTNSPPSLILLQKASWPYKGYERIEKFPEFSLVLQRYDLVVENAAYRIYSYRG